MSPHRLGAELSTYYNEINPSYKTTTWEGIKKRYTLWIHSLALEKAEALDLKGLVSKDFFYHAAAQLDKQVVGVYKAKYGEKGYEAMTQLRKNASYFAAHKAAYFTEWMRGTTKGEKEAIRRVFLNQLEVESAYASRGARAAKQWEKINETKESYPNLEYLPSRSVAKRENHKRYYGMIRPIDDPFWNTGLPPNGWNCKCRVRPTDGRITKAMPAIKPIKGMAGNAGKKGEIFTQSHPFFRNVKNQETLTKEWRKLERKSVTKWAKDNTRNKNYPSEKGEVFLSGKGIKEIINNGHKQEWEKNMLLYDIKTVIKKAKFIKEVPFDPNKRGVDNFDSVLYFRIKINNENSYLVVRKEVERKGSKLSLHAIVDKIK